jgi:hypothetical protein
LQDEDVRNAFIDCRKEALYEENTVFSKKIVRNKNGDLVVAQPQDPVAVAKREKGRNQKIVIHKNLYSLKIHRFIQRLRSKNYL